MLMYFSCAPDMNQVARCFDTSVRLKLLDISLDKGSVAQGIGLLDFLCTLVFIAGALLLRHYELVEVRAVAWLTLRCVALRCASTMRRGGV